MKLNEAKYKDFSLVKEMLETADVVRGLDLRKISSYSAAHINVLFSGEGSSRIFPAKNLIYQALITGYKERFFTENGMQAQEYDLSGFSVFVASNSGKTAEGVALLRHLKDKGSRDITGLVAHADTPIMNEAHNSYLLSCGDENAVAATKSVVEQALFYDIVFRSQNQQKMPDLTALGDAIQQTLEAPIPQDMVSALAQPPMLYFAGRNNGVAEELRLKTNEITRKKSDYLEGTYAVHGIEEVMQPEEAVIVIDPFPKTEEKFHKVLSQGVGLKVFAIAPRQTSFPTFQIPSLAGFDPYIQLVAGWNLLVEIGLAAGINLDKPERARKVGNEFEG